MQCIPAQSYRIGSYLLSNMNAMCRWVSLIEVDANNFANIHYFLKCLNGIKIAI